MIPQDVEAVVFDAGGVLLEVDWQPLRDALGIDLDEEVCRQAHFRMVRDIDRHGFVDWTTHDRMIAAEAGVPADRLDEAVGHMERMYNELPWLPVAGAAEGMRAVQAAGYRMAIVSNAHGQMAAQLEAREICSANGGPGVHVEIVVDSHLVGVEKPDPAIFGFALDALGLHAERCAYVGDTVHFDVNGARAAGLHPIHLDPYRLCDAADHPHVRAIADLLT